jgi:hypothetical protein
MRFAFRLGYEWFEARVHGAWAHLEDVRKTHNLPCEGEKVALSIVVAEGHQRPIIRLERATSQEAPSRDRPLKAFLAEKKTGSPQRMVAVVRE